MTQPGTERLTAAELQELAGADTTPHDIQTWRSLTMAEDNACRAQADEQLAAGVHPRDVHVILPTRWGWIEGVWLADTAPVVEPRRVAVRVPSPSLLDQALTPLERRVWDFTVRGLRIYRLWHFAAWCSLFGACVGLLNHLVGLGWTFASVVLLGLAGELWVYLRRRAALRVVPINDSTREVALLAADPATDHDQLWQAAGRHLNRRATR